MFPKFISQFLRFFRAKTSAHAAAVDPKEADDEFWVLRKDVSENLRARFATSITFVFVFFFLKQILHVPIPSFVYWLLAFVFFSTLIFRFFILPRPQFQTLPRLSAAYAIFSTVDVPVVMFSIFYVGGYAVGGSLLLAIFVITAFLLFPYTWQRALVSAAAMASFIVTTLLEYWEIIVPIRFLPLGPDLYQQPHYLAVALPVTIGLLFFLGYYGGLSGKRIRRQRAILRRERQRSEVLVESLTDGVLSVDGKGTILLLNRNAQWLLGILKKGTLTGRKLAELPRIHKSLQELTSFLQESIWQKKKSAVTREFALGEPLNRSLRTTIVRISQEEDTESVLFLIILRDITREQLVSRMKSEFISIAAHQLRTPLSAAKWVLKLLLEGDYGILSEKQSDAVSKGYEMNERMIRLVSELLDVARIEEGRFGYLFASADLADLTRKIVEEFRTKATQARLTLDFIPSTRLIPKVHIDAAKIRLVVEALLENAILYSKPGGSISIIVEQKDEDIHVSVRDTGIGIPQNQVGRLFTKFFRADNAMRMQTEGHGLGLFLARNIVRRHGGEMFVASQEKRGSTFTFTLPISSQRIPKEDVPPEELLAAP